jgi:NTP pyrophosphatase (non-canonical NTP hydrolase)
MDLQQYIADATRTESKIDVVNTDVYTMIQIMRAFVAAGSLLDMYKKHIFYGKPINEADWHKHEEAIRDQTKWRLFPPTFYLADDKVDLNVDPRIFHSIVGMATESTELVEALLKSIVTKADIDTVNLTEECGDSLWYMSLLMDATNTDWDGVFNTNIAKLKKRYPDKFTSDNAINRDIAAERELLESHQS